MGPSSRAWERGLWRRIAPRREAAGQPRAETSRGQRARTRWRSRSWPAGGVKAAEETAASPGWARRMARRAGWALRVPVERWRARLGLKERAEQSAAWNRSVSGAVPPLLEIAVPVIWVGSQEVGLWMKPGRSRT